MSRASRELIGQSIGEVIGGAFQRYGQKKEEQRNQAIADDPNASDLQRAVAIAKIAGSPIGQQFLKNQQRQTNLQALQESIANQLNPQGAGGPQQATRNATDPNQFMQGGGGGGVPSGFINPAASAQQNQGMGQNVPAPVNAPQQVDPIQELAKQEQAYKDAAFKATNMGLIEEARRYENLAKSAQKERLDIQNANRKQEQFQTKQKTENEKQLLPIQQDAEKSIKGTNIQLKALQDQLEVVNQTGQFSKANLSKFLHERGYERLANAAQSQGGAIFATAGKEVITGGLKNAFGARPLGIEFQAFDQMLAQVGRSPEVNRLSINSLMIPIQIENDIAKFKMDTLSENPEISPIQLNSAAYRYGEQITDQYLDAWKQQVREVMNKPTGFQGFFSPKPNKNVPKPTGNIDKEAIFEDAWK